MAKITVTPKFSVRQIINETIRKDWFIFQAEAFALGQRTQSYMQNYIRNNAKRRGVTGKLAKSIDLVAQTGAGFVSWGVGTIANLPPYWYVINYGKMITGADFIPGGGKFIPGSFEGSRPEAGLAGGAQKFNYNDGTGFGMIAKRPVRPMNYIQMTHARLNANLRNLINRLRVG